MKNYSWKKIIQMPIVLDEKKWNLNQLEKILSKAVYQAGKKSLKENNNTIYTVLLGDLNSAFLAALLRQEFPKADMITFSIGSPDTGPNLDNAKKVADKLLTNHFAYTPEAEEIAKAKNEIPEKLKLKEKDFETEEINNYLLFQFIKLKTKEKIKSLIMHNGIQELMGGQGPLIEHKDPIAQKKAFQDFWQLLPENELIPLERNAALFDIKLIFPFLQKQVVKYISQIPMQDRVSEIQGEILIRKIAQKYLPESITKLKSY